MADAVKLPRAMSEAEIVTAARDDVDAAPMSDAEFAAAKRVPRIKTLCRALRLTQEQFSEKYFIPLGALRDWEQSAAAPDATARAYIRAIEGDPEGVLRALAAAPGWCCYEMRHRPGPTVMARAGGPSTTSEFFRESLHKFLIPMAIRIL
jgi:putative transcriptional regulator